MNYGGDSYSCHPLSQPGLLEARSTPISAKLHITNGPGVVLLGPTEVLLGQNCVSNPRSYSKTKLSPAIIRLDQAFHADRAGRAG